MLVCESWKLIVHDLREENMGTAMLFFGIFFSTMVMRYMFVK